MPGPASHRCLFLLLEGPGAGGIGGRVENPIHAGGSLAGNDSQEASSILSQHVTLLFAVGFIDGGRPRGGRLSKEFGAPVAAISLINAARKQSVPRF